MLYSLLVFVSRLLKAAWSGWPTKTAPRLSLFHVRLGEVLQRKSWSGGNWADNPDIQLALFKNEGHLSPWKPFANPQDGVFQAKEVEEAIEGMLCGWRSPAAGLTG